MSSGVSDRSKRQSAAGKHMETYECDAIPWSQQVDEASYENLSSPTDNRNSGLSASIQFQNPPFIVRDTCINEKPKKAYTNGNIKDPKTKCYKPYYCDDSRWNENSCSERKINSPKVSYNTKKDNINISQKMTSRDTHKVYLGDTSGGGSEDHKILNYSSVDNSSMPNDSNSNKKKITWASIASQPAKPNKKSSSILLKKKGPGMPPPPMIPGKHNLDINAWEPSSNIASTDICGSVSISIPTNEHANLVEDDETRNCRPSTVEQQSHFSRKQLNFYSNKPVKNMKGNSRVNDISRDRRYVQKHIEEQNQNLRKPNTNCMYGEPIDSECNETNVCEDPNSFSRTESSQSETIDLSHVVLKKLKDRNNYNPAELDMQKAALSRFFVIKSYSEDDIHRSIKYEIWCSTDHGNKRLDEAFKERVKEGGNVMLFFSVNGSGHFCGMAQMMTSVDYNSTSSVWSQDKWKGKFKVKWIYVKDVPNSQLRHIRLENNDNKSVTNSRDTQEVPNGKGLQVLRVLHLYKHQTSIFDDFYHYEKKQEESVLKKPQFDSYIHPSSSSNVCHNDIKEQNTDRFSGNFRDRIVSHRGGHHNFLGNRRSDKTIEPHPGKHDKEKQQIISNSVNHDRGDNEIDTHSLQRHKNSCSENCSSSNSKRNFKEIILHMNNFNCNENNIALENTEAKLL